MVEYKSRTIQDGKTTFSPNLAGKSNGDKHLIGFENIDCPRGKLFK
jgi:hypothetical protein